MREGAIRRTLVVAALGVVACSSDVRLDGSSEESFVSSYDRLLESLTPEEKLQLTLAQAVVLSSKPCAQHKAPIPDSAVLTEVLGGLTQLRSCREELDGMSYQDFLDLSGVKVVPEQ